MRNGFQLLETRTIDELINVEELEKKYSVFLPPLYKLFIETFKLPLLKSPAFIAYYPDKEVGFDDFNDNLERIIEIYSSEDSYNKKGMLPIIRSGIHSGGICVCISNNEHKDKIFLNDETIESKYQLLSDNIFEFVRGLIEVEDGEDLSIYKK